VNPPIPAINIDSGDDDIPAISITIDEPSSSSSSSSKAPAVPVFSFSGPDEDDYYSDTGSKTGNRGGHSSGHSKQKGHSKTEKKSKGKHSKEKSVKEEEDERDRLRQLAKTRPLPPKIKKNSVRCGKCDKIILGRIVTAMGARWHPECFRYASRHFSGQKKRSKYLQVYCMRDFLGTC
jgi:hypothetical protein